MGEEYAECLKTHEYFNWKVDGCQEFRSRYSSLVCDVCFCHRNFHRKVVAPVVVYTKCHKLHSDLFGCQEFKPDGAEGTDSALRCAICRCDKGFHRNVITT